MDTAQCRSELAAYADTLGFVGLGRCPCVRLVTGVRRL